MDKATDDLFLAEYLGLKDLARLTIVNPFNYLSTADKENPHLHLLRLMRNSQYLGFTAKHIFNIDLAPFQLVALDTLWNYKYPMFIATRGGSKSFLLGLYALMRALLHQGAKIVIVGAAFRQAKIVFEYAETIWHNAPILRDIVGTSGKMGPKHSPDSWVFNIGDSTIIALPLGDGGKIRGHRANYIITDEFAVVPKDIYETVVSGFANVSSSPIEQVKNSARLKVLKELGVDAEILEAESLKNIGNQAIIAGTADYGFRHFHSYWKLYKSIIESRGDIDKLEKIFNGEITPGFNWKDYAIFRLPVELLPDGFMDAKHVARSKATVDSGIFALEMGAVFLLDSNGFFKASLLESCTTNSSIDLPSGPVRFAAAIRGNPRKKHIFGIDPASEKDNFSIFILEDNLDHRRVVYGWTTTRQKHKEKLKTGTIKETDFYGYCARKIRDLMHIFPCSRIAMDSQGGGIAIMEALHDTDKVKPGEHFIWPIIIEDEYQDTDDKAGLHILEMVQFADSKYTYAANHGMRKDLEDKVLLFPYFDTIGLGLATEYDKMTRSHIADDLEDVVFEIQELKDELTTIVHTQTGAVGRDHWDTPETKLPGNKKGRLRKDRYSALLMANMAARTMARADLPLNYKAVGGFAGKVEKQTGNLYIAPDWFNQQMNAGGTYGRTVSRTK